MTRVRGITARDVPDDIVEIVVDAIRICRRADEKTTGTDVIRSLTEMHTDRSDEEIRRAAGYAAMLIEGG